MCVKLFEIIYVDCDLMLLGNVDELFKYVDSPNEIAASYCQSPGTLIYIYICLCFPTPPPPRSCWSKTGCLFVCLSFFPPFLVTTTADSQARLILVSIRASLS